MTPSELGDVLRDARSSIRQALPAFAFTICINSSTSHNLQTMTTCLRCTPATATARQPAVLAQPHQVGARPALAACLQAAKARGNTTRAGLRGSNRSHYLPTRRRRRPMAPPVLVPFGPLRARLGPQKASQIAQGREKLGLKPRHCRRRRRQPPPPPAVASPLCRIRAPPPPPAFPDAAL